MNKKRALYLGAGGVILAVVLVVIIIKVLGNKTEELPPICRTDADCVKVQTTCCPCDMGGEEKCMLKMDAIKEVQNLNATCKPKNICIAMYTCKETSCKCVEGRCTG